MLFQAFIDMIQYNMGRKLKKLFFLGGDLIVLHAALAFTLFVRYRLIGGIGGISPYWQVHWYYFWGVFLIFILVFYINNLYSLRQIASARNFLRSTINSVIIATLLSIIYFYIYPRVDIAPKTNLAIFAVSALIGFLLWRRFAYWLIRAGKWQNNIALIGSADRMEELKQELDAKPELGYHVSLIINNASDLLDLENKILNNNIRLLVLADDLPAEKDWRQQLFPLLRHKISFSSYNNFYEQLKQAVPVSSINQNWFLENLKEGEKNYFDFFKRIADLAGASIFFLICLPLSICAAIAVKLSSPGPIIFCQYRLGLNGKNFKLYKFRTMRVEDNNFAITIENDRRITKIGRFLRASRLDEIPQLLNIIKGEMSFIGPRPERPELAAELSKEIPFYDTRLLIKPGLTGWDQISGEYHSASAADTMKKLQNDLYYIKHRSLYLDLSIILKTMATVVARSGR